MSVIEKIRISESYLEDIAPICKCPKKCGGTMIQVYVRYEQGGDIKKEWECSKCGKVIKNLPWKYNNKQRNKYAK